MTEVLLTGVTGTLGVRIAHHLLANDNVTLRLLVRSTALANPVKRAIIDDLVAGGAALREGDLSEQASLDAATKGAQVIVSAVQGGPHIIIDGQLALARAAQQNGAQRFIPSDFALDIFAAPEGAPTLALRRDAAKPLESTGLDILHILNGGFMDMMLARGAGMIDLANPQAAYWGTGDEPFDLTTVDDTAQAGTYQISGSRTSVNAIAGGIEQRTGRPVPRRSYGSLEQLKQTLDAAGDPWAHVMEWYSLALFTTPPFEHTDNNRYPAFPPTSLDDYLDSALAG